VPSAAPPRRRPAHGNGGTACHERVGERVGLALERIAGLADFELVLSRAGHAALLHRVGNLMSNQALAALALRIELSRGEVDLETTGVRPCPDRRGCRGGRFPGMNPHVAQVRA